METLNKKMPEYDTESLYPNHKCLSSTQFLCYEKNPADFYTNYMLGVKRRSTAAMEAGRIFSAAYADRSFDFKAALQEAGCPARLGDIFATALKLMPVQKGGSPEFPLIGHYKGWDLRATLDDFINSTYTIIENKTGQMEWTQDRANYSDQITFQAFCHWLKFDIPPRKIIVNWVDLRQKNQCRILSFKTSRSIKNMEMFEKRVQVVINNLEAGNFTKPIYEQ